MQYDQLTKLDIHGRVTRLETTASIRDDDIQDIKDKVSDIHTVITATNLDAIPARVDALEKRQTFHAGMSYVIQILVSAAIACAVSYSSKWLSHGP